jgi:hypothetical protein
LYPCGNKNASGKEGNGARVQYPFHALRNHSYVY